MKSFVRSEAYVKARLVTGGLFVALGIAIFVRTARDVGFSTSAIPAYVLGLAMIGLGGFRLRDYLRARMQR